MISPAQMRAARALLGLSQKKFADLTGVSLPTIQRMESSEGPIRGNIESLRKIIIALDRAGIELIAENSDDTSGRGVRFKKPVVK